MVRRISPLHIVLCIFWLMAVGAGFAVMLDYQYAGGRSGLPPGHWPKGTSIALDPSRDTLIMFAHPKCPCTRASIEELNRVMARCHDKVATHVLFFRPCAFPRDWTRSGLWQSAAAVPGVEVEEDADGAEARRFCAQTSGYVLLYSCRGQLLFHGGITGGRGHGGDNAGERAVVGLITGGGGAAFQTPVYGCSLLGACDSSTETSGQRAPQNYLP